MKKRCTAIVELVAIAAAAFALTRELIAEFERLDSSPEQRAILGKAKAPLAKLTSQFKETVKGVFGLIARIGR